MNFGRPDPMPHNHQPCDGPYYTGCPACAAYYAEAFEAWDNKRDEEPMSVDDAIAGLRALGGSLPDAVDAAICRRAAEVIDRLRALLDDPPTAEQAAAARAWGVDL